MKLLHVDSSILGDASVSRKLSAAVVARYRTMHRDLAVVRRDLGAAPLPHLEGALVAATRGPGAGTTPAAEFSDDFAALDEFMAADVVVIGAPMYNFGVSSLLKAWIDRVVVPGKTFAYVDGKPKRLAGGKTVVVASARGGVYTSGPFAAADHQESYLRAIFDFMSVSDLRFVRVEGLAMGPEAGKAATDAALAEIEAMAT